jgi:hypothetical protein
MFSDNFLEGFATGCIILSLIIVAFLLGGQLKEESLSKGTTFLVYDVKYQCEVIK